MKIRSVDVVKLVALLALACFLPENVAQASGPVQRKETSHIQHNGKSTWKWVNDDIRVEMTMRGKVEFDDDYTDVVGISPDGSLRLEDERGGTTRRLEIEPGPGGGLKRTYYVNGEARPYDDQARSWFAGVMQQAVQSGFDARARARKILARQGPDGLLNEVARLKGDYVRAVYLMEMLGNDGLSDGALRRALQFAAREIKSDYEKARVLLAVSKKGLSDDATRAVYLEAVGTVGSDYEQARVLIAVLSEKGLSKDDVMLALKAADGIASDYEKARVLIKIADNFLSDDATRNAYVEAIGDINSDYERGRVLAALLKKEGIGQETLMLTVRSASGMSSDYEKANVLVKVAARSTGDQTVRDALVEAAKTIKSEYERGRVLNAIFK